MGLGSRSNAAEEIAKSFSLHSFSRVRKRTKQEKGHRPEKLAKIQAEEAKPNKRAALERVRFLTLLQLEFLYAYFSKPGGAVPVFDRTL